MRQDREYIFTSRKACW